MSAHTPGPWVVEQIGVGRGTYFDVLKHDETQNDSVLIARIEVDARDGGESDARLIAAAPEMLVALKVTLGNLRSLKSNAFREFDTIDAWISVVDRAIAKAEGQP